MMLAILEVPLNGFIVTRSAMSWSYHMSDDSNMHWQAHLHLLILTDYRSKKTEIAVQMVKNLEQ